MPNKMSLDEFFNQSEAEKPNYAKDMNRGKAAQVLDQLLSDLEPAKPADPTEGMGTFKLGAAKGGSATENLSLGIQKLLGIDAEEIAKNPALARVSAGIKQMIERDPARTQRINEKIQAKRKIDAPLNANTDPVSNVLGGLMSPNMVAGVAAGPKLGAQILAGAAMGGLDAAESGEERIINAGGGALGAGVGGVAAKSLGKLSNSLRGEWSNPEAKRLVGLGDKHGVNLTAGDLGSNTARVAEDLLGKLPLTGRQASLRKQAGSLSEMLTKQADELTPSSMKSGQYEDGSEGRLFADRLLETYNKKEKANDGLWDSFEGVLANSPNITNVRPANLYTAVQPIFDEYSRAISGMSNEKAARTLYWLASDPAAVRQGMTFSEMRKLTKSLGQMVGQAKKQQRGGTVDSDFSGYIQQAYAAAMRDVESWGRNFRNQAVGKSFAKASDDFKTNILPYRQTPVIKDLVYGSVPDKVNGGYEVYGVDPDKLLPSLIKPGQSQLLKRAFELSDTEGQQALKYSLFKTKAEPTFNADTGDVRPSAFQAKDKRFIPANKVMYNPAEQASNAEVMDVLGAANRAKVNVQDPTISGVGSYMLGSLSVLNPIGALGAVATANAANAGMGSKAARALFMAKPDPFTGGGPLSRFANSVPGSVGAKLGKDGVNQFLVEPE